MLGTMGRPTVSPGSLGNKPGRVASLSYRPFTRGRYPLTSAPRCTLWRRASSETPQRDSGVPAVRRCPPPLVRRARQISGGISDLSFSQAG